MVEQMLVITPIISCLISVAGFYLSINNRANDSGRVLEKVDNCCEGIKEIKAEIKERNKSLDKLLDNHAERITRLEEQMETLYKEVRGSTNGRV